MFADARQINKNFILVREEDQHCWWGRAYNNYKKIRSTESKCTIED